MSPACDAFVCECCDDPECACLHHSDPELQAELVGRQVDRIRRVLDDDLLFNDVIHVQMTYDPPLAFHVIQDDGFEYHCDADTLLGFLHPGQLELVAASLGGWVMLRI